MVESAGVTCREPLVSTAPMPSMLTSVAFVVCQVRVVDWPGLIVFGLADSDAVGAVGVGGGGGGGGAAFFAHAPRNRMVASVNARVAHLVVVVVTLVAVSYTHLDVYKRQPVVTPDWPGADARHSTVWFS